MYTHNNKNGQALKCEIDFHSIQWLKVFSILIFSSSNISLNMLILFSSLVYRVILFRNVLECINSIQCYCIFKRIRLHREIFLQCQRILIIAPFLVCKACAARKKSIGKFRRIFVSLNGNSLKFHSINKIHIIMIIAKFLIKSRIELF